MPFKVASLDKKQNESKDMACSPTEFPVDKADEDDVLPEAFKPLMPEDPKVKKALDSIPKEMTCFKCDGKKIRKSKPCKKCNGTGILSRDMFGPELVEIYN